MSVVLDWATNLLGKIFGTRNERLLRAMQPIVAHINSLEPKIQPLSNSELRAKTDEFRRRLASGETLDDILPEAFAVVREAARRTVKMRHFDVQLIGGIVLHQGKIAEMATGEGKTLVATLAAYLNGLTGKGVHIVTVNDYLARRDRAWMGPVYELLGLTVGVIQAPMGNAERKVAYAADVTYGTNNEFGFDYLRDNMKVRLEDQVQRELHYAIVDEVDSILIDEARTPLIISGPAYDTTTKYYEADRIARALKPGVHFEVKEKEQTVILTEAGIERAERLLGVDSFYTGRNMDWPHHIDQALRAHHLYKRDKDYIVKEGQVVIVDEFTGRLMPGRVWSDGLHQAIEAKERLKIKEENQTLATITLQNYFLLYEKLAGMTGTAATEAVEFDRIYGLDVVVIPTNRPLIRYTYPDVVYLTEDEKFEAIVREIETVHKSGRPILVGTISIEKSERLSKMLKARGIRHEVLNAKHHEREAEIIAKAGQMGNVTIATNMAGRGTDIVLGEGVAEIGGLHVIGSERHEARRIDNQLRGRSGRQGDPGSSRFFVSLEDDLMRIFAGDWVKKILARVGMGQGQELSHPIVSRAIEKAQRRVEEHNFEIRKHLLEYDEVMNEQRKIVYSQRQEVLKGENLKGIVFNMIDDRIASAIEEYLPRGLSRSEWNWEGLVLWMRKKFGVELTPGKLQEIGRDALEEFLYKKVEGVYEEREREIGPEAMREVERFVLLQVIDTKWKDHLHAMDQLKAGIGLRGYGQKDPKIEYKREGYELFSSMIESVKEDVTNYILKVKVEREAEQELEGIWSAQLAGHSQFSSFDKQRAEAMAASHRGEEAPKPYVRSGRKIGRNEPCPCGSGRKYKHCCGKS